MIFKNILFSKIITYIFIFLLISIITSVVLGFYIDIPFFRGSVPDIFSYFILTIFSILASYIIINASSIAIYIPFIFGTLMSLLSISNIGNNTILLIFISQKNLSLILKYRIDIGFFGIFILLLLFLSMIFSKYSDSFEEKI